MYKDISSIKEIKQNRIPNSVKLGIDSYNQIEDIKDYSVFIEELKIKNKYFDRKTRQRFSYYA